MKREDRRGGFGISEITGEDSKGRNRKKMRKKKICEGTLFKQLTREVSCRSSEEYMDL